MGAFSDRYAFYLPGGGSSGTIQPDEAVDIDKLNDSFKRIDAELGLPYKSRSSVNSPAPSSLLKDPTDGEIYTYISGTYVNALPARLLKANLDAAYLAGSSAGALDSRYYTQAQLNSGQLDSLYFKKGINGTIPVASIAKRYGDGVIPITVTTADSDGGHTGFSGTVTFVATSLTTVTSVTATLLRASSQDQHIGVKSISGNTVTLYAWSSNSGTYSAYWQAMGS